MLGAGLVVNPYKIQSFYWFATFHLILSGKNLGVICSLRIPDPLSLVDSVYEYKIELSNIIQGALSMVLLIIYNCSVQFLTIRERRKTRSREKAIQMARQEIEAQNHWKVAEHLLRSRVNGMQGHLPHALRSFVQHTDTENSAHRVQETP